MNNTIVFWNIMKVQTYNQMNQSREKGGRYMIQLCEELELEIMKFFLKTSIPKIINERKGITSKQKKE